MACLQGDFTYLKLKTQLENMFSVVSEGVNGQ